MLGLLIGFVLGIIICYYYLKNKEEKKNIYLEYLKNALLSYALMRVCKRDVDDFNMIYNDFDGTKLPMFSGSSITNASFSYIIDKKSFREHPFYTPIMEEKIKAIDKYLDKNLNSEDDIYKFFEKCLKKIR
jgi:hypothetical protein